MFCFLSNYAGENTLHGTGHAMGEIKKTLSYNFRIIGNWFLENLMVVSTK